MAPKKEVRLTGRYVICPASFFLHSPELGNVLTQVKMKDRAFMDCSCSGRSFMGHGWHDGLGYTFEQARALGTVTG